MRGLRIARLATAAALVAGLLIPATAEAATFTVTATTYCAPGPMVDYTITSSARVRRDVWVLDPGNEQWLDNQLVTGNAPAKFTHALTADTRIGLFAAASQGWGSTAVYAETTVQLPTCSVAPFVAYSPDSYFRTPIPADAQVAPDSATGVAFMQAHDPYAYPRIRGVQGNKYGMTYALGQCSDPVWHIGTVPKAVGTSANPSWWQSLRTGAGFHAPDPLPPFPGSNDDPFVIVDHCTGITIWGADGVYSGVRTINVSAFGAFEHASNGLDRRNPASDSAVNERSRGIIPDSMLIRDDLLAQGVATGGTLGHVLEMFFVETNSAAGFTSPMIGAENGKFGYGAEGQRIRVKAGVDMSACTPEAQVVLRTLQFYGAYLGDNSGAGSGIKAQQGSTALTQDALSCLPGGWDSYEFLAPTG